MLRSSIYSAGALLIGATAFAQSDLSSRVHPITAPVKNAGTLNLATGQWTRHGNQAQGVGPGTIYNNTCDTPYYFGIFETEVINDEGRIPSTTSPAVDFTPGAANGSSRPGCADSYAIDGFQIAYCSDEIGPVSVELNFFELYDTCEVPPAPVAAFAIDGLPGSSGAVAGSPNSLACWIVTFDLNAPPQTTSLVFSMLGDGDGVYDADLTLDLFGWTFEVTSGQPLNNGASGPLIQGDEFVCAGYDGTVFDSPVVDTSEPGTGMTSQDAFRIDPIVDPPTAVPGCYWFGGAPGNPFGSFHLELYQSDMEPCNLDVGLSSCTPGDGTTTTMCPCFVSAGQIADPGHGCGNSVFTGGAIISATGSDFTAGADDVTMTVADVPTGVSLVILLQGASLAPLAGTPFHDGVRCMGTLVRITNKADNGCGVGCQPLGGDDLAIDSSVSFGPGAGDPSITSIQGTPAGTFGYAGWYRNAAAGWCPPNFANISQQLGLAWF